MEVGCILVDSFDHHDHTRKMQSGKRDCDCALGVWDKLNQSTVMEHDCKTCLKEGFRFVPRIHKGLQTVGRAMAVARSIAVETNCAGVYACDLSAAKLYI